MEGSSSHEGERTATFYVYHPCYFLEQALGALLRCLGIESGTTMCSQAKEEKTSLPQVQTLSGADPITNSPSNTQKSSQDAADPPSTTNQTIIASSLAIRRDSRGSGISHGSGESNSFWENQLRRVGTGLANPRRLTKLDLVRTGITTNVLKARWSLRVEKASR
ncbi:hypothetical protein CR513_62631, partial [Mucuna pruriens]